MIGLQVVNLFLEQLRPEVFANKLDCLQMIIEPRPIHCVTKKNKSQPL